MLQQTQVSRVVEYYRRFLEAFPTVEAVAATPLDAVLRLWEGLGYYSRARSFHAACRIVAERHAGRFPDCYGEAVALPGVGDYTAGAVLSIAFGRRLPAIDANAKRVLCRVLLEHGGTAPSRNRVHAFGEAAVPADRPGEYNQALMELGSLICRPAQPRCGDCHLTGICRARRAARQTEFPRRRRGKTTAGRAVLGIVRRRGRVLIARRPRDAVWGGLWEFPNFNLGLETDVSEVLRKAMRDEFGLTCGPAEEAGSLSYGIMNRRVRLHVYSCTAGRGRARVRAHEQVRWVRPSELSAYPLPAPHRRAAERYVADPNGE
jgi:A/G-specific adenine glycosylase